MKPPMAKLEVVSQSMQENWVGSSLAQIIVIVNNENKDNINFTPINSIDSGKWVLNFDKSKFIFVIF